MSVDLAGFILAGRLNSANALMADPENLRSIAAVVIGGTNLFGGEGGVIGSMIGALIMGVLANGLNLLNMSAFWQRVIQGLVIVLVVIFDQWRRRRFGQNL
jgi:ribose/xylose/arabinose/galactoside ABC-type transport system permease subunit